jgi:microcystin-dependent protein
MGNTTNFSIEKPSVGGARNSWGGIVNVGIDKLDELLHLAMPIGTIQMYPLSTAPTATLNGGTWLVCDGTALLQANYADLFSLIGITYGDGTNASTHFNLPDFQARVPVGYNVAAIGSGVSVRSIREMATTADGTEAHILTDTQISKHSHTITDAGHIHPIDPTTTHSHIGDQTGGKTGEASAVISESEHFHGTFATAMVVDPIWQPGGAGAAGTAGSGIDGDIYSSQGRYTNNNYVTGSKTTGLTDSGHAHTLTTDAKVTGITTTQTNPIRLSTTNNQADGDSSHNNMQPYITVQYIILAKHPTFT